MTNNPKRFIINTERRSRAVNETTKKEVEQMTNKQFKAYLVMLKMIAEKSDSNTEIVKAIEEIIQAIDE